MKFRNLISAGFGLGFSLAAATAYAQSSVSLYGIVDTGVEYVTHADANGNGVLRMPGITGELPSRWGFRGNEDLGGGLSAQFVLESGINMPNGSLGQGGRLFGRQAWVGINSPYGLLSFGRQYTMLLWAMADSDILGPDIYGMATLDPYLASDRSDNTVAYRGKFQGLTLGATYSFGRDSTGTGNTPGEGTCAGSVPGQPTQCRQLSAMVKYDTSWFGVSGAYDEQRGGTNAAAIFYDGNAPFPFTKSGDKDVHTWLGTYAVLGSVKVSAGFVGRSVTTVAGGPDVHSDIYSVGASWQATPSFMLDGEAFRIINQVQDARATMVTLRGTYHLSKRTAVYLQSAYLTNSAHASYEVSGAGGTTPPPGQGQLGVMAGLQQLF
jgi:predicted porin